MLNPKYKIDYTLIVFIILVSIVALTAIMQLLNSNLQSININ
jgi:hypothetical protein